MKMDSVAQGNRVLVEPSDRQPIDASLVSIILAIANFGNCARE